MGLENTALIDHKSQETPCQTVTVPTTAPAALPRRRTSSSGDINRTKRRHENQLCRNNRSSSSVHCHLLYHSQVLDLHISWQGGAAQRPSIPLRNVQPSTPLALFFPPSLASRPPTRASVQPVHHLHPTHSLYESASSGVGECEGGSGRRGHKDEYSKALNFDLLDISNNYNDIITVVTFLQGT